MAQDPRNWEAVFLAALENTGTVGRAAEAAGIDRQTVYDCQRADPEFAMKCLDAFDSAADAVLSRITRLAVQGELVPVYHQGRIVGYELRQSDTLLMYAHQLLLQQSSRVVQRTQTQPERPAAVWPSKPPVEIVAARRDRDDRPLNDRPATGPGRAA